MELIRVLGRQGGGVCVSRAVVGGFELIPRDTVSHRHPSSLCRVSIAARADEDALAHRAFRNGLRNMAALLHMTRGLLHGDWRTVLGVGFGTTGLMMGGALAIRQKTLRESSVFAAASQQLSSADAVRDMLGSEVVATGGIVGGYLDPIKGTAVLTIPLEAASGVATVARVEAEAEWVGGSEAEQQASPKAMDRWLLRHLEVERPAASAAVGASTPTDGASAAAVAGSAEPLVLYSLPARVPLSQWAPPPRPSIRGWEPPRWCGALFPWWGVGTDDDFKRLGGAALVAFGMHLGAFLALRARARRAEAFAAVQGAIRLRETPALLELRDAALTTALRGRPDLARPAAGSSSLVHGAVDESSLRAYTLCAVDPKTEGQTDVVFTAARASAESPWELTHVGLVDGALKELVLAEADASDADAVRAAVGKLLERAPALPLGEAYGSGGAPLVGKGGRKPRARGGARTARGGRV